MVNTQKDNQLQRSSKSPKGDGLIWKTLNTNIECLERFDTYNPLRLPPIARAEEIKKDKDAKNGSQATNREVNSAQEQTTTGTSRGEREKNATSKGEEQAPLMESLSLVKRLFEFSLKASPGMTWLNMGLGALGAVVAMAVPWIATAVATSKDLSALQVCGVLGGFALVGLSQSATGFLNSVVLAFKEWSSYEKLDQDFLKSVLGRKFHELNDNQLHQLNQELNRHKFLPMSVMSNMSMAFGNIMGFIVAGAAYWSYSPYLTLLAGVAVVGRLTVDYFLSPFINAREVADQSKWSQMGNFQEKLNDPKVARELMQHHAEQDFTKIVDEQRTELKREKTSLLIQKTVRQVFGSLPLIVGSVMVMTLPVVDALVLGRSSENLPKEVGAGAGLILSALGVAGFWGHMLSNRVLIKRFLDFIDKYANGKQVPEDGSQKDDKGASNAQEDGKSTGGGVSEKPLAVRREPLFPSPIGERRRDPQRTLQPMQQRFDSIEFKNVTVTVGEHRNRILSVDSLVISAGQFLGIVGPVGGGKTTFLRLLMKEIEPDIAGSIVIKSYVDRDGVAHKERNLSDIDTKEWHTVLSMMYRDYPDMEGLKIREAVTLGKNDVDEARMRMIAGMIRLKSILPKSTNFDKDTIGAKLGGKNFSGGQRQALALMRAMCASKCPFVVLDEPGANFDAVGEKRIVQGLRKVANEERMTMIMVSHAYNTILDADQIIVIHEGRVESIGSFKQVSSNSPAFQNGYRSKVESLLPGYTVKFKDEGPDIVKRGR